MKEQTDTEEDFEENSATEDEIETSALSDEDLPQTQDNSESGDIGE